MTLGNQRGQALPVVLTVMLLLVLLAGGATMAISAVLHQQTTNRKSTNTDLASQNSVAATAATIHRGNSACNPAAGTASPGTLFEDRFQVPSGNSWSLNGWSFLTDQGQRVLAATDTDSSIQDVATPASVVGGSQWSYYSASINVRPRATDPGTSTELDAYYLNAGNTLPPAFSYYWLVVEPGFGPGGHWEFGRTLAGLPGSSQQFSSGSAGFISYDTQSWTTLEVDVYGRQITAVIDGHVVARRMDTSLAQGSFAVRAQGSRAEVNNVLANQPVAPFAPAVLLPSNLGLPSQFSCQRLDGVDGGAILEQRAAIAAVSPCTSLGATITIPGAGAHVMVWYTVAWPSTAPLPQSPVVALGTTGCPPQTDFNDADCGRQRSSSVAGNPDLIVVGADCINANPSADPNQVRTYTVFFSFPGTSTPYRGSLAPVSVRWAVAGTDSVYMTAAPGPSASGQPYEESDLLVPRVGTGAFLSYEGVLG